VQTSSIRKEEKPAITAQSWGEKTLLHENFIINHEGQTGRMLPEHLCFAGRAG